MSLEIRTLNAEETQQMLDDFNRGGRVSVMRRDADGKLNFEPTERPLTMDDFTTND